MTGAARAREAALAAEAAELLACHLETVPPSDRLPLSPADCLTRLMGVPVCRDTDAAVAPLLTEALPQGRDAMVIPVPLPDGGLRRVVLCRASSDTARLRFSLAHELGHIALHHVSSDPVTEREANRFAAYFLCPEPLLLLLRDRGLRYVEQLMCICFISRSAAMLAARREARPLSPEEEALLPLLSAALPKTLPQPRPDQLWIPLPL